MSWGNDNYDMNNDQSFDNDRPKFTPRPGDWDCPSCGKSNFARRSSCFRCDTAKPGDADNQYGGGDSYGYQSHAPSGPRPGDWDCTGCGQSNFARRTDCFKCGEARPEGAGASGGYGQNQGAYDSARRTTGPVTDDVDAFRSYKWASSRARYEYNANNLDENGMARRNADLEKELFDDNAEQQTTLDFSRYESIRVSVERGERPEPLKSFDEGDINPVMKENIRLCKFAQPTPVQQYSIPIVTRGDDLMACAQTGSGKTAAFLVPTLSALFGKPELVQPRPQPYEYRTFCVEPLVLILAPTRELCSQIFDDCRRYTYRSNLRPCAIYGGAASFAQLRELERGCDILAAAPGRLMDFIQRRKISLKRVKYLILDEADRMLDMGFEGIIRNIVEKQGLSPERQTLMFSATFPRAIRKLARDFLRSQYTFLKVGRIGGTTNSITQKVMYVPEEEKREAVHALLNSQPPSRTLIFVETKRSADSLDQYLFDLSFPTTSIHGDRTQMEREDALQAFKSGQCPILVATAVAARGIDIRNVMHVINYDMPNDMDEYIHRIGRTARVGKSGLATSFYNERSEHLAPLLTKLLKENNQPIPDFLEQFYSENVEWEEDQDDENVAAPSYAGQDWTPQDRQPVGGPGSFANNASGNKGAADAAFNSGGDWNGGGGDNNGGGDWNAGGSAPWDSGNAGGNDGGWGNDNTNQASGGWDSSAPAPAQQQAPAPTNANWGASDQQAPASSDGGWGASTDAPAAAPSNDGWGASAPAPAAAPSNDGWGAPSGAPAEAPSNNGWGAPTNAPASAPAPAPAPAPSNDSWGTSAGASADAPSNDGWGAPADAPSNDSWGAAPSGGGWGSAAP
ncbi:DEAD-domain-containing protein [Hesseltinella vesiculosa]|uniref:ATP-dependent RNA helicase DED1 n=1 Tax=Hesseltinella vesiculosa TaxID=101127 RepID=A0A1X2G5T0_9FUNG|nr:DEAD-domain-containing protein [Hesseltinella vesiculosa]